MLDVVVVLESGPDLKVLAKKGHGRIHPRHPRPRLRQPFHPHADEADRSVCPSCSTISRSEDLMRFRVVNDDAPANVFVYDVEKKRVKQLTDNLNPEINRADLFTDGHVQLIPPDRIIQHVTCVNPFLRRILRTCCPSPCLPLFDPAAMRDPHKHWV